MIVATLASAPAASARMSALSKSKRTSAGSSTWTSRSVSFAPRSCIACRTCCTLAVTPDVRPMTFTIVASMATKRRAPNRATAASAAASVAGSQGPAA